MFKISIVIPLKADTCTNKNTVAESETDSDGNGIERGSPSTCAQCLRLIIVLVVEFTFSLHEGKRVRE